jgi:GNAT superfamily N-acetyltransferase
MVGLDLFIHYSELYMRTLLRISDVKELPDRGTSGSIDGLSAEEFLSHQPDLHLVLFDKGILRARCSLWWSSVPLFAGEMTAYIGHYEALENADAHELLANACQTLQENGALFVIGPIDGTTWRRYRLITRRGEEPPFFLEPDNPDSYPGHFEASGFSPLARYYSSLEDNPGGNFDLPDGLLYRLQSDDIVIRHLDTNAFMDELSRIYEISTDGFRGNFLYSDISRDEFFSMYTRVQQYVHSEMVLFAEQKGRPVGFIFAVPDVLRTHKGHPLDTVILKSMAVMPEMNGRGIGTWLRVQVSRNAWRLGFKRSIHALMHEHNRSRGMGSRNCREIRQYTLYSRKLS